MRRSNLLAGLAAAALLALPAATAQAQSPQITVGLTATVNFGRAPSPADQACSEARPRGRIQIVPLNSQLPACAVGLHHLRRHPVSGPTAGHRGRPRHVAVAGSGLTDKDQQSFQAVAGRSPCQADDFIGKKVGAPGLGAFLHVLFRNWLIDNGVDTKKVTFVEVGFPQMADVLKGGNVDAVVTGEPVMGRIVSGGIGKKVTSFTDNLKVELPIIVYSATRTWVDANPAAAKAFREAIAEATEIANKDHAAVRASTANFIKMPPEVIANMKLGRWQAEVTDVGVGSWIDIMKRQDMLRSGIDVKVIAR
jgi:NitT/TauT family transport system substrate-binding protein